MRITLTVDDDLAGLLKRRARELGVPFDELVNRTLRAGLGEHAKELYHTAPRTIPHAFGFKPGVNLDKLNQLVDELEADASAAGHGWRHPVRRLHAQPLNRYDDL